jgi:conjugal transfer pilus assembly protein TraV
MKTLILRLGAVCLLLPLAACMNMSGLGGDSKYACKAPDGVACDSVSGTYANALHNNLPSQQAQRSARRQKETSEENALPHGWTSHFLGNSQRFPGWP